MGFGMAWPSETGTVTTCVPAVCITWVTCMTHVTWVTWPNMLDNFRFTSFTALGSSMLCSDLAFVDRDAALQMRPITWQRPPTGDPRWELRPSLQVLFCPMEACIMCIRLLKCVYVRAQQLPCKIAEMRVCVYAFMRGGLFSVTMKNSILYGNYYER